MDLDIRLKEMRKNYANLPCGPWKFIEGDDFDHWQLYSPVTAESLVQDDSGVQVSDELIYFLENGLNDIVFLLSIIRQQQEIIGNEMKNKDCKNSLSLREIEDNLIREMLEEKIGFLEMDDLIYPPCKKCGASHGMGIENMETGVIEPIDMCRDCLWIGTAVPINVHITLDDLKNDRI